MRACVSLSRPLPSPRSWSRPLSRAQCLGSAAGRACRVRDATRIRRLVTMAEGKEGGGGAGGVEREGGGGGVAVLTQPPELDKAAAAERASPANFKGNWRVLLHRDDWDTFDYCRRGLACARSGRAGIDGQCACASERARPGDYLEHLPLMNCLTSQTHIHTVGCSSR